MIKKAIYILSFAGIIALNSCSKKDHSGESTNFTKVDSLTETYLLLQDSLLHAWNVMAWDEKEKIKSMHQVLHLMHEHKGFDDKKLISLEQQLDQLNRIRFSQKSVSNTYLIEEYDLASGTLGAEIFDMANRVPEFYNMESIQKHLSKIEEYDSRVLSLRQHYNYVATQFNNFIEANKKYLKEIDKDCTGEKIAVFNYQ